MTFTRPSLVYFIKPVGLDGPIKIGCSGTPADRLENLAAWSPWPLEVIGSIPGSYAEEAFLHSCFADFHSHREWFHSTPALRGAIAEMLAAGSIDPARQKLKPVRRVRRRRESTEWERKHRSYSARIRIATDRLRSDDGGEVVYYSVPSSIQKILDRWYGRSHYKEPRNPILPSGEELAALDRYISDPVGQGAVRRVIERLKPKGEVAA